VALVLRTRLESCSPNGKTLTGSRQWIYLQISENRSSGNLIVDVLLFFWPESFFLLIVRNHLRTDTNAKTRRKKRISSKSNQLPREDWDFTAIGPKYLGPAIVYEYSREWNGMKRLSQLLNSSVKKIVSDRLDKYQRIIFKAQRISSLSGIADSLTAPDYSDILRSASTGDDVLTIWKEKLADPYSMESPTHILRELKLLMGLKAPDLILEFLIGSKHLRACRPWTTLNEVEMKCLDAIYCRYFHRGEPVSFLIGAHAKYAGLFEKEIPILIDWTCSDPQIVTSFKNQLASIRPRGRSFSKEIGRAAALPYESLKQLAAFRLGKTMSREQFSRRYKEPSATDDDHEARIKRLWPRFDSDGAWSGAKTAAKKQVMKACRGNFSFAEIKWSS
jgi:hypothetical protein